MNLDILTREDLNTHFGESSFPLDDDNEINEAKILEDLKLTDKEIENNLIAAGLDLNLIKENEDALIRLKPIALDICFYRLNNMPAADTDMSHSRYKQALSSLQMIVKGLLKISETTKESKVSIKIVKLVR